MYYFLRDFRLLYFEACCLTFDCTIQQIVQRVILARWMKVDC